MGAGDSSREMMMSIDGSVGGLEIRRAWKGFFLDIE